MDLFAPSLAFVDLETTGTHAGGDRITEVGIVRVDADAAGGPPRVHEWSTLIDPEVPIPAVIQALTGITDAMVAGAPTFSAVAGAIEERIADCVFVAHNARFDHGFLKHAYARIGRPFNARPLCTVRLSRRLFPEAHGHGLDAIVARHGIDVAQRHRALGDARAIWAFVEMLYRTFPAEVIATAARRILKIPSLPPQLPPDSLERLPETPGVYLFFGENPLPIYIGKSVNLRERVGAHFAGDWQSETDLRLSQEIRRIEVEETAGELGALLREATLVKSMLPAHNRALRRKEEAGVLVLGGRGSAALRARGRDRTRGTRRRVRPVRVEARRARGAARARRRARAVLAAAGPGEARGRPLLPATVEALRRRVRRRRGRRASTTSGSPPRSRRSRSPRGRSRASALVREPAAAGERTDVHVLRDWCWLGTARDDGELGRLLEAPPPPRFDIDVARMLLKRWSKRALPLVPAPDPMSVDAGP